MEISEIGNGKNRQKAMKPKVDYLKKIYKINKPLAKLTRKKTENSINRIISKRENSITNLTRITNYKGNIHKVNGIICKIIR